MRPYKAIQATGNDMEQAPLFHDDEYDAIRDAVRVLGGNKPVGSWLWPSLAINNKAGEKLAQCLNPDHAQKLSFSEILAISRKSAEKGCHSIATYVNRDGGYIDPTWRKPEDIEDEARREFVKAVTYIKGLSKQLGVAI